MEGGGDNWSYKSCKAAVKSSPLTNQHLPFYRLDTLPGAQPTVLQQWRDHPKMLTLYKSVGIARYATLWSWMLQDLVTLQRTMLAVMLMKMMIKSTASLGNLYRRQPLTDLQNLPYTQTMICLTQLWVKTYGCIIFVSVCDVSTDHHNELASVWLVSQVPSSKSVQK